MLQPAVSTRSSISRKSANSIENFAKSLNMSAEVERLIKSFKVVVVSKSFCPYCKAAKNILNGYSIKSENMHILEIDGRSVSLLT